MDLTIVSNMWKCQKFINLCRIEKDTCTVIGAACGFGYVHNTEIILKPTLEMLIYCICDIVQFDTGV